MLGPVVEADMQELELTSWRLLRLWWAISWRWVAVFVTIVGVGAVLMVVASIILGRVGHVSDSAMRQFLVHPAVLATWVAMPVSGVTAIRLTLASRIGGFRLGLLSIASPETSVGAEVV